MNYYSELAMDDIPREMFEQFHIKNVLGRDIDPEPFEKFIRVMGPIKPKHIKMNKKVETGKSSMRETSILPNRSSPLKKEHSTDTK